MLINEINAVCLGYQLFSEEFKSGIEKNEKEESTKQED